jgi:hypothetical protein
MKRLVTATVRGMSSGISSGTSSHSPDALLRAATARSPALNPEHHAPEFELAVLVEGAHEVRVALVVDQLARVHLIGDVRIDVDDRDVVPALLDGLLFGVEEQGWPAARIDVERALACDGHGASWAQRFSYA